MTHLNGEARARYVQEMFSRIAPHYDLMNRLMAFGQDRRWRKRVIEKANLPPTGGLLLDLGAGTGDLGLEVSRNVPGTTSIEADFTIEMMLVGRCRPGTKILQCRCPFLIMPLMLLFLDSSSVMSRIYLHP